MHKYLIALLIHLVLPTLGFSHPVAISFMVADVKYSKERGVQICEIQHGSDSVFKGDAFSNGGSSLIIENFVDFFAGCNRLCWVIFPGISDRELRGRLAQSGWTAVPTLDDLQQDPAFSCGGGVVFAHSKCIELLSSAQSNSSHLLIDQTMLPVWRDKYMVSQCLSDDPLSMSCKPKWGLYEKKYDAHLAGQIIDELGSSCIVIKPRDKFCGRGVILVEKQNLDRTLKYILGNSRQLRDDPDRAFSAWYNSKGDDFLVEEFVPADPVLVPHLGMHPYSPTLRIAFLIIFEQGVVDIHFLGGCCCLPEKSLVEEGTLHEKFKASLETVHSSRLDPETYSEVINELAEPLRRFYKKVLDLGH